MTSPTPDLVAVVERVEKLERELRVAKRRNRWLLVAVGLARSSHKKGNLFSR